MLNFPRTIGVLGNPLEAADSKTSTFPSWALRRWLVRPTAIHFSLLPSREAVVANGTATSGIALGPPAPAVTSLKSGVLVGPGTELGISVETNTGVTDGVNVGGTVVDALRVYVGTMGVLVRL